MTDSNDRCGSKRTLQDDAAPGGTSPSLSRRQFVAAASGTAAAVALHTHGAAAEGAAESQLALNGGPKAVGESATLPIRWGEAERERLNEMLGQQSLFYWNGPQTELLKERFREFCPLEHVQTCSSGTAALHIAVEAAGIAPGDEVITSPVTDIGTVIGVIYQQGVPVFADLKPHTYTLEPEDVARKITPRTKAIIVVHLTGNPSDMTTLRELADEHRLVLIEDCAQAWGARYQGQPIGTVGDIACFSLQNSKHVTCGDGGVVASSHPDYGPDLQKFGDKGFDRIKRGGFAAFSTNYRMSEPQAAVAAAQLTRLEEIASTRARLGDRLSKQLADIPGITPHEVAADDRCVYWFYMFRMDPQAFTVDRGEFVKALRAEGVQSSAGYIRVPLYGEPVFQQHGFFAGQWPVRENGQTEMDYTKVECHEAEAMLATGVRMVVHEAMTDSYIDAAAKAVAKVARHYRS